MRIAFDNPKTLRSSVGSVRRELATAFWSSRGEIDRKLIRYGEAMDIDAHHASRVTPSPVFARDFLPNDLKPQLERAGFDGGIAVRSAADAGRDSMAFATRGVIAFHLGVVGWVDLQSADGRSQLAEFAKSPKLLGVLHIVQSGPGDSCAGVGTLEGIGLT